MGHGLMLGLIDEIIVERHHDSDMSISWQSHDSHQGDPLSPVPVAG
jgi:hypothetical protein